MAWILDDSRPIYLQIVDLIKTEIIAGVYRPGDKLPSVRDLAMEASVNPNTMQKALTELERSGLVYTQRTNGRFITEDIAKMTEIKEQLAKEQIRLAFDQAEKEVEDLHQRTREGIQTARLNGKQIGQREGARLTTKKSLEMKPIILQHCKDFGGSLSDIEIMKLTGLARNTYYRYKAELKANK